MNQMNQIKLQHIMQLLMLRWDLFRISSKHIRYIYSYKHLKSASVQQICDTYVPYRIFFVVLLPSPGQVFFNTQPKLYNSIDNFAGHKLTKQHASLGLLPFRWCKINDAIRRAFWYYSKLEPNLIWIPERPPPPQKKNSQHTKSVMTFFR